MLCTHLIEGRNRPDPLPKLIAAHVEELHRARVSHDGPIVLIGKSVGSVVCFGYPLCGAADPTKLRDKVLRELVTPILFIQGTGDRLCPLSFLQPIQTHMAAPNNLHIVEQGDHSLLVTKGWLKEQQKTQEDVNQEILLTIRDFLEFRMGHLFRGRAIIG